MERQREREREGQAEGEKEKQNERERKKCWGTKEGKLESWGLQKVRYDRKRGCEK